jgi:hypothetical protein
MAAGRATLVHKGERLSVTSPELIDAAQALPLLPANRRRTFERIKIGHFMRARISQSQ